MSPKPSRLPSPRVELIVRTFDEGDAAVSYVTGRLLGPPLAGLAELAVICRAYSPENQLMFEGLLKGSSPGDANPRPLAEAAGVAIAKGLTDPESTRPNAKQPNK